MKTSLYGMIMVEQYCQTINFVQSSLFCIAHTWYVRNSIKKNI